MWPGCQRAAQGLAIEGLDLMMVQEHKITKDKEHTMHGWARREGWKAAFAPANITPDGGVSAGTAV